MHSHYTIQPALWKVQGTYSVVFSCNNLTCCLHIAHNYRYLHLVTCKLHVNTGYMRLVTHKLYVITGYLHLSCRSYSVIVLLFPANTWLVACKLHLITGYFCLILRPIIECCEMCKQMVKQTTLGSLGQTISTKKLRSIDLGWYLRVWLICKAGNQWTALLYYSKCLVLLIRSYCVVLYFVPYISWFKVKN